MYDEGRRLDEYNTTLAFLFCTSIIFEGSIMYQIRFMISLIRLAQADIFDHHGMRKCLRQGPTKEAVT